MQRKKTFNAFGTLKASLLSVLMSFCVIAAFAQGGTVKGTVTDDTGEPVIGANVVEKGSTNGTITDIDGNYSLQVTNMNGVLQFSFIGYNTTEENIGGRTTINVQLNSGVINLGEVVAIGYGTQTRREITGSVTNVDEASFNKGISRDASDLLRGKVAGLSITSGSADITQGSMIRLRGTSTLMNDQGPMIVIDGVPGGDMSSVAPSDIESISVLKDASSQAIYGSRAAGGVILITTKKGTGARTTVNYDGYVGIDVAANKPDMLTAQEWIDVNKQLGNYDTDAVQGIVKNYHADTDWFGEVLRTGFSQSHSVSLTGGSSTSNYRASYTYLDRQGVAKNNGLRRHSFRFQVQQRALKNKLRLTLDASGTLTDAFRPQGGDFIRAYNMIPLYPVYNPDGSWFEGANGALYNEYDMGNPVHAMAENYNKTKSSVFYGRGEIQYDIIDGLNIKADLYKSRSSYDQSVWNQATNYAGAGSNSNATRNNWSDDRLLMEYTLNFDKTFGDHKVGALAGYSWESNEHSSHYAYVEGFDVTSMGADNIQTGSRPKAGDVTSGRNAYKLISFFGRATYSYKERYMVTATIRRDGSSKFGKNHKWGTFPSVSAAWGISQEPFMQNVKWVDDLKLRAGYGVTGNQDGLSPYKSLELYESYGTYGVDQKTAFRVSQNANPDLKWESTHMFNIGLDFALFHGRLGGTIEYYSKKTKDMLYNYSVPTPTYVYNTIAANVGDMTNKGIELTLNWNVIKSRDFDWTTVLTLSHNENKVTRLSNDFYSTSAIYTGNPWIRGQSGQTSHIVEEGRSLGNFYNLKCLGLDADGHFIYEDVNGDKVISDDDRTYIGNALPKAEFGWTNNFTWKNWDFSFFIRGTIGNKILNNPLAAYGTPNYIMGTNAMKNDNLTKIHESAKVSSFWIENGSFARLDNMTLGYTFDTKKLDWLSKARLYVTAQNLFVITGYKGLDPEVNYSSTSGLSPGIESREYFPKSRSFIFGVNLTF